MSLAYLGRTAVQYLALSKHSSMLDFDVGGPAPSFSALAEGTESSVIG